MSKLTDREKKKVLKLYQQRCSLRAIARQVKKRFQVVSDYLEPFKEIRGSRSKLRNVGIPLEQLANSELTENQEIEGNSNDVHLMSVVESSERMNLSDASIEATFPFQESMNHEQPIISLNLSASLNFSQLSEQSVNSEVTENPEIQRDSIIEQSISIVDTSKRMNLSDVSIEATVSFQKSMDYEESIIASEQSNSVTNPQETENSVEEVPLTYQERRLLCLIGWIE